MKLKLKKISFLILTLCLIISHVILSGCGAQAEDPGSPPPEVLNGEQDGASSGDTRTGNSASPYEGDMLEDAVSVRIGRDGRTEWPVNMYNNAAVATMLNYLSSSALLFPTYTYEEEQGFVAQSIRGSYSRDDEITVTDIKAGELFLLSGGQLRFYFKDLEDANITATPVGYYSDTEGLTEAVQQAYEANLGDTWGVDVYFWITKTIE